MFSNLSMSPSFTNIGYTYIFLPIFLLTNKVALVDVFLLNYCLYKCLLVVIMYACQVSSHIDTVLTAVLGRHPLIVLHFVTTLAKLDRLSNTVHHHCKIM